MENSLEQLWIFIYHLQSTREEFLKFPIYQRTWIIERFFEQKEKENAEMKKAQKK